MQLELVATHGDIDLNIATAEQYRCAPASADFVGYTSLIKLGTCFLPYVADGKLRFMPSRFIGYKNNDLAQHAQNDDRNGRETNVVLNRILGSQPVADTRIEQLYIDFCHELHIAPNKTGNFGVARRYWLTRDVIALLADVEVARVAGDPAIPPTTRQAIIEARIGQGRFRRDVIAYWGGSCAATGCGSTGVLRASHIKPWWGSSDVERVDPYNGKRGINTVLTPAYFRPQPFQAIRRSVAFAIR
jgi:putative restriction endonuclease